MASEPDGIPNKGGRPKGSLDGGRQWLARVAHQHAQDAIATLAEVMQSKEAPPAARIKAAAEILDRAHGKPATAQEEHEPDRKVVVNVYGGLPDDGAQHNPDPAASGASEDLER